MKIFENRAFELIFALLCGLAYFGIVHSFLRSNTGYNLLSLFFCPIIICAPALFIIKAERKLREEERCKALWVLVGFHILLMIISLVMIVAMMNI